MVGTSGLPAEGEAPREINAEAAMSSTTLLSAGHEAPLEANPQAKRCIESNVRLRDSLLWKLQRGYFESLSEQGWPEEVPLFASSNAKLAQDYARLIFHYLRDVYAPLREASRSAKVSPEGPCLLVEIGAGHGRFTFMLLTSLLEFEPYFEPLGMPAQPFVLVLTDVVAAGVATLRTHPDLKPFVEKGWLDFALFDGNEPPGMDELLELVRRHKCKGFSEQNMNGNALTMEVPIVAICNYALDSLMQEALQFGGAPRVVREGLISVYSPQEEPTFRDPSLTSRLTFTWSWQESEILAQGAMALDASELDLPGEYDEGYLAVVREYLGTGEKMTALMPLAGFRIAQALRRLAGHRLLMLIGDKGYQDTSEFSGWQTPHIAVHGSFSMMVNFDALRIYFESFGGWAEHTPYADVFQVWVYAAGARSIYPSLLSSLVDCRNDLGPGSMMFWSKGLTQHWDHSLALQESIPHNMVSAVMALLRYGQHDPDLFWQFQPLIYAQCTDRRHLDSRGIQDLATDLILVYRKQFRMQGAEQRDLAAAIGECLMRMGCINQAASLFRRSLEDCGPRSEVLLKLSACLQAAGSISEAVEATEEALRLDPASVPAESRLQSLEMHAKSLGTALIGGSFTMFEQTGPSLAKDMRFHLKAIHAFAEEEARLMAAALENWQLETFRLTSQGLPGDGHHSTTVGTNLQHRPKVLWGADGLKEIMQRADITVCIADVHHKMLPGMLQKLWMAGKHVLSPSPLAYSLEAARALVKAYQAPLEPGVLMRPAWHALESARHEDALNVASQSLEKVGRPLCIALAITSSKTPATRKARAHVEEKLALELVHSLLVVQRVANERLGSIVVQAGRPGTNECKSEAALVGHFSLHPVLPIAAGSAASIGTFVVCHAGSSTSEPGLEVRFHCAKGALVLRHEKATWQITVTDDRSGKAGQKSIERSVPSVGHNFSRKAFVEQIKRSAAAGTSSGNAPVDVSVQHALADTAILESVFSSMRNNGANMGFKYNS